MALNPKQFGTVMKNARMADTVIYPDKNLNNSTYQKLQRHLLQCDEKQLKTLLAITEAVLSVDDTRTDNSDI